jgi:bile acid:Na+ symporter, BASS family
MVRNLCERFTRLMPLWVVGLGAAGFLFPEGFVLLRPGLNPMFFLTMVGIGAVLNFNDFMPVVKKPQVVVLGLVAQFTIMPALGFLLGLALDLSLPLKLGLILAGCMPGAMASNVISYLARTDVAYSIAVTTAATLLSPVLIPALTWLYASRIIEIPLLDMIVNILGIVIAPIGVGFLLRHFGRSALERVSYVFPALSTLCIAVICAMVVALNRDVFFDMTGMAFIAVFLLNLLGLVLGYGAGVLYRFDVRRRRTLSIEVGMQNAGLGAVLALNHFGAGTALVPALFATWCVITASLLAEYWARRP